MRKKPFVFIAVSFGSIVIIALGCYASLRILDYFSDLNAANQSLYPGGECIQPPAGFSRADLIGTWVAMGHNDDTLIIREDGTYKQIIHIDYIDIPDVDYESDWQRWWLDYSYEGIPYVHLEGMRLCAAEPGLVSCDHPGGGDIVWNDFCQHKGVYLNNEGILIILGSPAISQPPRGIHLFLLSIFSENPWAYELQEP